MFIGEAWHEPRPSSDTAITLSVVENESMLRDSEFQTLAQPSVVFGKNHENDSDYH